MVYEYEGFRMVGDELAFFPEGFIGMKGARGLSEGEKEIRFTRFNRDENGVITGMRYQVQLDDPSE
ncbi:MAG TPA: hypothetical protein GXZ90_01155 [Clostridiales bacterium]|nr:hypothetical protein [Clostridiales bacterium]